jgi:hypothetical protein
MLKVDTQCMTFSCCCESNKRIMQPQVTQSHAVSSHTSLLSLLREPKAWTQLLTHSRHGDSDTDTNTRTRTHTYYEGQDSARKGHVSGN